MKYKIEKTKKDDPIYKKGFTISYIKDYFQSKKERDREYQRKKKDRKNMKRN